MQHPARPLFGRRINNLIVRLTSRYTNNVYLVNINARKSCARMETFFLAR
jgi:hypothetical protein